MRVPAKDLGVRVFADRLHGFALAFTPGGETFPADSGDGGRTWHVDGPVLHAPAAQGAAAVNQPGVAGPRFYFAWPAGFNTGLDVTTDAGASWWRASLPGWILSVTSNPTSTKSFNGLTAIVGGPTSDPNGRGASLWQYHTADGRRWRYLSSLSAIS
ncbi:MAG: hypothetical protein JOZ98_08750 [Solirubrobacterales bacterium]|nr:hypothetical protein [Solirubrobacterales bacterium]